MSALAARLSGLRRVLGRAVDLLVGREPGPVLGDARLSDAAALADIHAEGFERGWDAHEFARLLQDRSVLCQVSRPGGRGRPVGFALSRATLDEAEVLTVAVSGRCRGRGIAGRVLACHLERLAARRVRAVFLEVAEDNRPAIRLYRSAGFAEVGRRKGYYRRASGQAVGALVMRRVLA